MDPVRSVKGPVSVLDRSDIDTDQIIPKQFLKRIERTGFGEFLFYDWAKQPDWNLPANPILATGPNFGCGSSREHAPWALQDYGFQAVVAESDLEAREVRANGGTFAFELDDDTRHRLLNGLDDIALTLQQDDAIAAY